MHRKQVSDNKMRYFTTTQLSKQRISTRWKVSKAYFIPTNVAHHDDLIEDATRNVGQYYEHHPIHLRITVQTKQPSNYNSRPHDNDDEFNALNHNRIEMRNYHPKP